MKNLSHQQKKVLCFVLLGFMFILMGTTNNDPTLFIERIFPPFQGETWMISYAGIIVIMIIYYCLKSLNQLQGNSFIKTTFRRLLLTVILMSLSSNLWGLGGAVYKSFLNDLDAIYLDRAQTSIQFSGNEEFILVQGNLTLKNYSPSTQTFKIKIKTGSFAKNLIDDDYITLEEEFTLPPRSGQTFYLNEEIKTTKKPYESVSFNDRAYEYILFNEQDDTIFKGTTFDYHQ